MILWKEVRLDLSGDVQFHHAGWVQYSSITDRWLRVDNVNLLHYYQIDCKHGHDSPHYRLRYPDWPTLKEWLRTFYNDLEVHELDPKKYPVYQTIVGILIEGGSVGQIQDDIWFEVEDAASNSFREQVLLNFWEEVDSHGFPREQEFGLPC